MVCYTRSLKKKSQHLANVASDTAVGVQILRPTTRIAKSSVQRSKRRECDTVVQAVPPPHSQPPRLVIIYTEV